MSKNLILYIPAFVAGIIILHAGLTEKKIWVIQDSRTAAIYLAVLGMLICTLSIGKFIGTAPGNPLSIAGYLLGTLALFALLVQVFKWKVPVLSDPKYALIAISAVIVIKFVIARFSILLPK